MVDLPQVDEDQEDALWNVLELRCKDLILANKEERMSDKDVAQESLPPGSQDSQTSQSSHHLGCKKASKKVPVPQKAVLLTIRALQHRNVSPTPSFFRIIPYLGCLTRRGVKNFSTNGSAQVGYVCFYVCVQDKLCTQGGKTTLVKCSICSCSVCVCVCV